MTVPASPHVRRTGDALLQAVAVMDRLRSPGGCPWDAEQTHASLAPYAVEEAYEVAEAAESGDAAALADELGDLLLQVLFHARIASEEVDGFDVDDVARGLVAKLTRRHPHVFGDGDGDGGGGAAPADPLTATDVITRWDAIKATERGSGHVLDGVPVAMPALARAQKVVRRLRKAGHDVVGPAPQDAAGPADNPADVAAARIGDALLALVREAEAADVDAEAALRGRVRDLERAARAAPPSP